MEMISYQAERVGVRNLISVLPPQFHEISVIPLLDENILVVIAAIEDVIELSEFKRNWVGGHDAILLLLRERPDMSPRKSDKPKSISVQSS